MVVEKTQTYFPFVFKCAEGYELTKSDPQQKLPLNFTAHCAHSLGLDVRLGRRESIAPKALRYPGVHLRVGIGHPGMC